MFKSSSWAFSLKVLIFLNLFTFLFIHSVVPEWSYIHYDCLFIFLLNNNNVRSSGLDNMVTYTGWSYATRYYIFRFPLPLAVYVYTTSLPLLMSYLQQSFQWTNLAILSCLVLYSFCANSLHSLRMRFIVSPFWLHILQSGSLLRSRYSGRHAMLLPN